MYGYFLGWLVFGTLAITRRIIRDVIQTTPKHFGLHRLFAVYLLLIICMAAFGAMIQETRLELSIAQLLR